MHLSVPCSCTPCGRHIPHDHGPSSTFGGRGPAVAPIEGEREVPAVVPAHVVPRYPTPDHAQPFRACVTRRAGVMPTCASILFACTLVEGGSDGPSVCPSVVCPLVPTPDPHARRCATRRGGVDAYTLMPRCAHSSAACHCDTCQPLPRRLHAHYATDCCHACDMLGDIPFGGLMLAGTHGCMLHDLCLVPWRVRTPPRSRGRLHMSHAGVFRCPRLHRRLSRTNDQ